MIIIRTAEDMARALDSPPDLELRALLQAHVEQLAEWGLQDLAVFIVAQPGDALKAVEIAFGERLVTDAKFAKVPELISQHRGWFELVFILSDDGFGLVLFVSRAPGVDPMLAAACEHSLQHVDSNTAY